MISSHNIPSHAKIYAKASKHCKNQNPEKWFFLLICASQTIKSRYKRLAQIHKSTGPLFSASSNVVICIPF